MDGEQLVEEVWQTETRQNNLTLVLGFSEFKELPGMTTDLNIFSSALPVEQMKLQTTTGEKICGLEGDFLSWERSVEENLWTLRSKVKGVDLDSEFDNPCRVEPPINNFSIKEDHHQKDCMNHCKKLGGRSSSVRTQKDWEQLLKDMKALSPDTTRFPDTWLAATKIDNDLWPKGA